MNNAAMNKAVQKAVQPRFRGRATLPPRSKMHYPYNIEREYTRIVRAYMALLNEALAAHLPALRRQMDEARAGMRHDAYDEFGELLYNIKDVIMNMFSRVSRSFERQATAFNLEGKLGRIATQANNWSVSQWRRIVHDTLGINILEDYYKGEFFRHELVKWVDRNVGLIKSVPQETLTDMRNIVEDSWRQGALNKDIARQLEKTYEIKRSKAEFWARDQMAKLNGEINKQQQKDAGVDEYIWSTSRDERVRGNPSGKWSNAKYSHYAMEGKRCDWNNSTIYYNKKKGKWDERDPGWVQKHPKEDYRCRCVAAPVFNLPGLSLPWEGGWDD